jgi:hypothetical protein
MSGYPYGRPVLTGGRKRPGLLARLLAALR